MRDYDPARTVLLFLLFAVTACGAEPGRSGNAADAAVDARVLFDAHRPVDGGDKPADAATEENAAGDGGTGDGGMGAVESSGRGEHFRSGRRLQAQVWTFEGETLLFDRWYDTLLGEACSFLESPGPRVPCTSPGDLHRVHERADCSDDFFLALANATETRHATVGNRVYEVDEEAEGALYSSENGPCLPVTGLAYLRELAPEEVANRFVHATMEIRDTAERMTVRDFVADDGSRQVDALYDTELARRCIRRGMRADGGTFPACVPISSVFEYGYYTDVECSMPMGNVTVGDGFEEPLIALTGFDEFECGFDAKTVTGAFEGSEFYTYLSGSCEPMPSDQFWIISTWSYSSAAFDVSRLAELEHFAVGDGRLRVYYEGERGGVPLAPPQGDRSLRDTLRGFDCRPTSTHDGSTRCIPKHVSGRTGSDKSYADPSCQTELAWVHPWNKRYEDGCIEHPVDHVVYTGLLSGSVESVRELGAPYDGDVTYHETSDGACRSIFRSPYSGAALFEIGVEVPLDTFARLDRVTVPPE